MLLVKKYGGSSVSSPEKILNIAQNLKALKKQGHQLIIVVSAMGDTTDDLINLTQKITTTPIQREMDMLLSSGERISMALLAIALNSIGVDSISFTGSQSGVLTDPSHSNARIDDIKAFRVQEELNKGRIVIVAGFQGVNPQSKEITTLGRGGSDTTAVALAAAFKADRCDILTDVDGLYSADPRLPQIQAEHFSELDFDVTLEMAYWGARVLHYRSVELAERNNLPLLLNKSMEDGVGTLIGKNDLKRGEPQMEKTKILSVNTNTQVVRLQMKSKSLSDSLTSLQQILQNSKLPLPQILYNRQNEIFLTLPEEATHSLAQAAKASELAQLDSDWSTVTLTGRGFVNSPLAFEASLKLKDEKIPTEALIVTPLSVTFLISKNQAQKAAAVLHREFVEK